MRQLDGKIAVITGGAGGIGRVIIDELVNEGAHVYSLDVVRAAEPALTGAAADRDESLSATVPIECDLRDERSVESAFRGIRETEGHIDILVHAAGVTRDSVVWKLTPEDWDFVHTVNLRGGFLVTRAAVPLMRANGGRIVFIGSINGSRGKRATSAYSASKAGLIGLAKSVARETGRFGITSNVIEPGWVKTTLTESYPADIREAARAETLLGEIVTPADIAATVVFLCGDGGKRITGQVIRVDAGQYV